jgi:hypothetical protein
MFTGLSALSALLGAAIGKSPVFVYAGGRLGPTHWGA